MTLQGYLRLAFRQVTNIAAITATFNLHNISPHQLKLDLKELLLKLRKMLL
jgi:hypothetical protein